MQKIKEISLQGVANKEVFDQWEEKVISLPYTPPLDWEILLSFFRSHQILGIEQITLTSYERFFYLKNTFGFLRVMHHNTAPELTLSLFTPDQTVLPLIEQKIRRMFDLDLNTSILDDSFLMHPLLNPIWRTYPGLRLASGWDTFETAINTILGQLVSVQRAKTLMQQLIEHQGEQIINPITNEKVYLFPTPRKLANANLENLGTTQNRKKTIKEFSRRIADKEVMLETQNIDSLKEDLLKIPGIGPWSAEYIALRALGDRDSFPATDLVLKRALKEYPNIDLEKLKPWRSYAAISLWRHSMKPPSDIKLTLNIKDENYDLCI